jgi:hypothetical protein
MWQFLDFSVFALLFYTITLFSSQSSTRISSFCPIYIVTCISSIIAMGPKPTTSSSTLSPQTTSEKDFSVPHSPIKKDYWIDNKAIIVTWSFHFSAARSNFCFSFPMILEHIWDKVCYRQRYQIPIYYSSWILLVQYMTGMLFIMYRLEDIKSSKTGF